MKRKRTVLGFGMATSALLAAFLVTPVTAAGRGRSGAPDVPPRADGSWMAEVQRNIEAQEYEVTWQDRTVLPGLDRVWQAPNRAQGFRTYFTEAGIRVIPRTEEEPLWEWGLDLVGYGRGNLVWPVPAAALRPSGNRIEYARGAIEEWYANEPKGLEQGFRLDARPEELAAVSGAPGGAVEAGPRGSAVFVQLALKGTLAPVFSTDRQAIDFRAAGGAGFVRYSELRVTDAGGRELRAWMEAFAEAGVRGIRIVFDDTDAAYPVTIDPLATSPAWTAEGDQAYANFGASVATAGDVDGDGYSDVVVGAPSYDNGQADEGRAYVYRGSAAGLSATPAWTAESDQASAFFGLWVSTAGDVNGDGYSDVIVGAPCYDNGQADEGRAYVYHGSAAGVSGSPAWVAEADQADSYFGWSASTAGDVDGDGYSDVVVGAPYHTDDQEYEGRAYVFRGSAAGLSVAPSWTADGNQAYADFGFSVSTAGDVDGNGYADVVVGSDGYGNGQEYEGRAYVFHGSAAGLSATAAWTAESDQAHVGLGASVSTAGDVDGDGYADVAVGAWGADSEGRAHVYHGSAGGLSATAAWTEEGDQAGAAFAVPLATAGDVNGDGFSDLIVGAPGFDNGQTNEGRAYLYHGSAAGLSAASLWTAEGDQASSGFGCSVSTAGDVNGDGYSDVIVGARHYDAGQTNEGRAYVHHGSAAGLSATAAWTAEGDQASALFGESVSTAGDVNGDGYSDVIVGAYGYDDGEQDEGRAYVYHGSAAGLSPAPAWTAESDQASAWFGFSVSTAGDVNGDGYSDVIVGARAFDNGTTDEGRSYVYHGSAGGLFAIPSWIAEGDQAGAWFGFSVSTAGDVNGDGYSDVVVGACGHDNGQSEEGRAYVYHGAAVGLSATAAWTAEGDQAYANFGTSVATAGDVNGDGYSDLIVGADGFSNGEAYEGRAYVYHGSAAGLSPAPAWTAESDQASANFGDAVSTAGDVNGDGFSDVVVGAGSLDDGQTDEGRAYAYHGSAAGLSPVPAWTAESDQASAYFGRSVSTAGDVNGDGYADVVVGASQFSNGESLEGRAFLFHGNGGLGLSLRPQQRRADDAAPIAPIGAADSPDSFRLALMGRSPFGGGLAKLEWEVKPRGTLLDGAGTATSASWAELAGGAAQFSELVDGLSAATPYHWRARLRYEGASTPYQQFSRWITVPLNGWNETDLRTAAPPPVDADGDGYASDVDCDDGDPDVWRIPGEADSLRLAADEQTFSWEPPDPAGGTPESVRYDLLRSPVSIDFVGAGACAATDVVETSAVDGTSPAPGERLFYLVRAENACGAGSLGLDSAGSERAGRTCP